MSSITGTVATGRRGPGALAGGRSLPHEGPPPGSLAFQPTLTIRERVEARDVPSFVVRALREIRGHVARHHLEVAGPPFSSSLPAPHGRFDVEVGWPVTHGSGSGRIHSATLPTGAARRGA
jgi:hypothetical protein